MLHYNYSNTLSHFLSYHHFEEHHENEQNTNTSSVEEEKKNKSFTIAAILGLNGGGEQEKNSDLSPRLSLPARHGPGTAHFAAVAAAAAAAAAAGSAVCPSARHAVRGLKHLSASAAAAIAAGKKACKSKRVRTIFTPEQLERLEAEFERQQYMVGPERLYLAHTLQLTEAQVKVWFQNRRIKWRKHHLELTHQRLAVLKQQQILLDDDNHPDVQDTNSSSTDT